MGKRVHKPVPRGMFERVPVCTNVYEPTIHAPQTVNSEPRNNPADVSDSASGDHPNGFSRSTYPHLFFHFLGELYLALYRSRDPLLESIIENVQEAWSPSDSFTSGQAYALKPIEIEGRTFSPPQRYRNRR